MKLSLPFQPQLHWRMFVWHAAWTGAASGPRGSETAPVCSSAGWGWVSVCARAHEAGHQQTHARYGIPQSPYSPQTGHFHPHWPVEKQELNIIWVVTSYIFLLNNSKITFYEENMSIKLCKTPHHYDRRLYLVASALPLSCQGLLSGFNVLLCKF